jgi:hypothetical protein
MKRAGLRPDRDELDRLCLHRRQEVLQLPVVTSPDMAGNADGFGEQSTRRTCPGLGRPK